MKKLLPILLLLLVLLLSSCSSAEASTTPAEWNITALLETANTAVNAQLESLYDDYAAYYTPSEYDMLYTTITGTFGGIGVSMVEDPETGAVTVYSIIKNTPASQTEIAIGDVLLEADGISLADKDPAEAAAIIRGDIGSKVTVKLRRAVDNTEYEVTITRAMITNETVSAVRLEDYPDTVYISIISFNEQTAADFTTLFNQLNQESPIGSMILDLRSNGGGLLLPSIEIAEYFVPLGSVVVSEKTAVESTDYRSSSGQLNSLPVVILQNAYTASASEVLIGAIKEQGNATLIGTTTYGKGITQNVTQLESKYGRRYTRSIYYTPSGFSLHGIGIEPNILIEDPKDIDSASYFSQDPALNPHLKAALDYLYPDGPPPAAKDQAADADADKASDKADQ